SAGRITGHVAWIKDFFIYRKVEMVGRYVVTLAEQLRQPRTQGDAMQSGTISVFSAGVMTRFVWIEGRFKILDEIIAPSAVRQSQQVLHRRPKRRQGRIGVFNRSGKAIILSLGHTKVLLHIVSNLFT